MDQTLKAIYYDPHHPASLGSVEKLAKASKVPIKKVKKWLAKQKTYTLHRQARKHYPSRRYYVSNIDEQWQMDLADMQKIKRYNDGYAYILTCIDILSRYGWTRPLKSKAGSEVAAAIEDIFKTSERKPKRIQTDQGKEFYNTSVTALLKDHGIELFSVMSPKKCALVERWNRTLKSKMWKYFSSKNSYKWLEVLPKLVDGYNRSVHRVIKMRPIDVTKENAMSVWNSLYGKDKSRQKLMKVNVGDRVLISKAKGQFEKGYLPNWSQEEFFVENINNKFSPTMVTLKDHKGEIIKGNFYAEEIQKVDRDDDVYEVEKIVRQKRKDGEVWYLVKWQGYSDDFNSWIRKRDVTAVFDNSESE